VKPSNRLLLSLVGVALLAGCGGGESAQPTTTNDFPPAPSPPPATTTSGDPGKDAIDSLVAAARGGRADAMWSMLSAESKRRLGPTLARFRARGASRLAEAVGSFGRYKVIVSERITPEFGVVAIDGPRVVDGKRVRDVYAAALRLEGEEWKLELGGPVKVRAVGPDPGAHERLVAQIAAAVSGKGGGGTAVVYVDGLTENPKVYGTASNSTLVVNYEPALDRGRHTVVVFGAVGRDASASGWWFTAAKGPRSP
jgi:hypothetical protein